MSAECDIHGTDLVYSGEWPEMVCPICAREAELATARETIARLESDIRLLKGEADMAETLRWLSFQKDVAAILYDFAEKTVIALARLQEERDDALRNFDHVSSVLSAGGGLDALQAEADAARADVARMREVLHGLFEERCIPVYRAWTNGMEAAVQRAEEALTPDDGWLQRHDAEAVKPYRSMVRRAVIEVETHKLVEACEEAGAWAREARALLSGGTT